MLQHLSTCPTHRERRCINEPSRQPRAHSIQQTPTFFFHIVCCWRQFMSSISVKSKVFRSLGHLTAVSFLSVSGRISHPRIRHLKIGDPSLQIRLSPWWPAKLRLTCGPTEISFTIVVRNGDPSPASTLPVWVEGGSLGPCAPPTKLDLRRVAAW